MARQWLKLLCFVMANALALSAHATGLDGHDPVSYFAGGSPVKGSSAITAEFRGGAVPLLVGRQPRAFRRGSAEVPAAVWRLLRLRGGQGFPRRW